jgi:glycosyltransferase involved in cell wall biosynthesis
MARILIDARRITDDQDGLGYYSWYLTRRVAQKFCPKNRIYVVVAARSAYSIQLRKLPNTEVICTERPLPRQSLEYEAEMLLSDSMYESLKPDVFIGTAFFSTRLACPRIVVVPDAIPVICANLFPMEKVEFYRTAISEAINTASLILSPSHHTVRDLEQYFHLDPNNSQILYPDVNAMVHRVQCSRTTFPRDKFLVMIGVKCRRKNAESVVRALQILKSQGRTDCRVKFVGNLREDQVPLRTLVKTYDVSSQADVLGYVGDSLVPKLLAASYGLLFPSMYEGFGMPIIEALCTYRPVICSPITSIPEVVGPCGSYTSLEPEALAEAMLAATDRSETLSPAVVDSWIRQLTERNEEQFSAIFAEIAEAGAQVG